jgi:hypothetical protein
VRRRVPVGISATDLATLRLRRSSSILQSGRQSARGIQPYTVHTHTHKNSAHRRHNTQTLQNTGDSIRGLLLYGTTAPRMVSNIVHTQSTQYCHASGHLLHLSPLGAGAGGGRSSPLARARPAFSCSPPLRRPTFTLTPIPHPARPPPPRPAISMTRRSLDHAGFHTDRCPRPADTLVDVGSAPWRPLTHHPTRRGWRKTESTRPGAA